MTSNCDVTNSAHQMQMTIRPWTKTPPMNIFCVRHCLYMYQGFGDPTRVPRILNRVPRIRENYYRVHKVRENRVPRIREIGSLRIQTGCLTFVFKKSCMYYCKRPSVFPGSRTYGYCCDKSFSCGYFERMIFGRARLIYKQMR